MTDVSKTSTTTIPGSTSVCEVHAWTSSVSKVTTAENDAGSGRLLGCSSMLQQSACNGAASFSAPDPPSVVLSLPVGVSGCSSPLCSDAVSSSSNGTKLNLSSVKAILCLAVADFVTLEQTPFSSTFTSHPTTMFSTRTATERSLVQSATWLSPLSTSSVQSEVESSTQAARSVCASTPERLSSWASFRRLPFPLPPLLASAVLLSFLPMPVPSTLRSRRFASRKTLARSGIPNGFCLCGKLADFSPFLDPTPFFDEAEAL
mmetsp:Transcript_57389/g.106007  ORF Transcript_57389/g.106007 Transcript_57389/m.106007 type:complete len:261 (-) Transcript_57389:146-928(-)